MKNGRYGRIWVFLLTLTMAGGGCSHVKTLTEPADTGQQAKEDPVKAWSSSDQKLMGIVGKTHLQTIHGTARVQFSAPGVSERVVAEFTSSRDQMYMELRNTLGIVGAEILSSTDSVTILNKMDKYALRLSVDAYNQRADIRLRLPLNFLAIFDPVVDSTNVVQLQENDQQYKLLLKNGEYLIVDKQGYLPVMMVIADTTADRFTTFSYDGFEAYQGFLLPRRIQAVTTDRKSRIRIEISRLEINPKDPIFSLIVPPGILIYR